MAVEVIVAVAKHGKQGMGQIIPGGFRQSGLHIRRDHPEEHSGVGKSIRTVLGSRGLQHSLAGGQPRRTQYWRKAGESSTSVNRNWGKQDIQEGRREYSKRKMLVDEHRWRRLLNSLI